MTGGTVVVLGKTGRNFAAGMSGGIAYVFDEDGQFARRCNSAMVSLEPVLTSAKQESSVERTLWHKGSSDEAMLKQLIESHYKWTGSLRARHILDHWTDSREQFVKVFPHEYKRALGEIAAKAALTAGGSSAAKQAVDTIAKARGAAKDKTVPAK
jgi:glutamate synthase (NADPH) large chain